MARTLLTVVTPKGPYPGTVNALDLDVAMVAADVANKNAFPFTGREILIVRNSDTNPHTITLTSAPDARGRSADIGPYTVGAGLTAMFEYSGAGDGWQQSDGNAYLEASDATVKLAVIRPTR